MPATASDPEPAAAAATPFQILCTRCFAARWVGVAACDRSDEDEGWSRCCGLPVRCFVFGS